MLSPLKPLLCRHEFCWSERHRADRCRRCGKIQAAEMHDVSMPAEAPAEAQLRLEPDRIGVFLDSPTGLTDRAVFDVPPIEPMPAMVPLRRSPSAKVLKAEARERRENLLALLERIAEGGQLSRKDSLDAVLGVIEDAHSADPVLFGPDAAARFARLHEARGGLIF